MKKSIDQELETATHRVFQVFPKGLQIERGYFPNGLSPTTRFGGRVQLGEVLYPFLGYHQRKGDRT